MPELTEKLPATVQLLAGRNGVRTLGITLNESIDGETERRLSAAWGSESMQVWLLQDYANDEVGVSRRAWLSVPPSKESC